VIPPRRFNIGDMMKSIRLLLGVFVIGMMTLGRVTADDPATKPAGLAEVCKAVDWFTFPRPPGAQWVETDLFKTDYWVLGDYNQAPEFFRNAMTAQGWTEEKSSYRKHDDSQSLEFTKVGFVIALHLESKTEKSYKVHLQNWGNVDARTLPRPADAKMSSGGRTVVALESPAKPDAVLDFCTKEFSARGWREAAQGYVSKQSPSLRFVQNAMECVVTIFLKPDGSINTIIYNSRVREEFDPAEVAAVFAPGNIPKPATVAEALAVLDLRKLPRIGEGELNSRNGLEADYEARTNIEKAGAFYRKTLTEQGWVLVPPLVEISERGYLRFQKGGYFVTVETRDLIDEPNKAGLLNIKLTNHGNVDLRQLPYPPAAAISPYRQQRRFTTSANEEEVKSFYRQVLPKLGWKEAKSVFLEFLQSDSKLVIIIHKPQNGQTPIEMHTNFGER
jgi:hypothetical protein